MSHVANMAISRSVREIAAYSAQREAFADAVYSDNRVARVVEGFEKQSLTNAAGDLVAAVGRNLEAIIKEVDRSGLSAEELEEIEQWDSCLTDDRLEKWGYFHRICNVLTQYFMGIGIGYLGDIEHGYMMRAISLREEMKARLAS